MATRTIGAAVALIFAVGCAAPAATSTGSASLTAATPLSLDNGTDLTLTVAVNGRPAAVSPAHSGHQAIERGLPPMPWRVELLSPSGRVVLALDVEASMVTSTTRPDGHTSMTGAAARADLSCGRLDVWVGPPLAGPPPGPGDPGDCAP